MSRRPVVFLVLLAFLWQAMAAFGSVTVTQVAGDINHMLVHGQATNHHHHADDTLQLDDDAGLVQHVHADSGAGSSAILSSAQAAPGKNKLASPPAMNPVIWRAPFLDGPLRPPMQHA